MKKNCLLFGIILLGLNTSVVANDVEISTGNLLSVATTNALINIAPTINEKLNNMQQLRTMLKGKHQPRVSINFNQADIKSVINFFSSEFKVNIVLSPEVSGKISFNFDNIDSVEAFDAILTSNGFDWYIENDLIRVHQQMPSKVFHLNYASADDVAITIKQLINTRGYLTVYSNSNSLIIKAPKNDLINVGSVIEELDKIPPQVLVEVQIMELQNEDSRSLGLDINYTRTSGTQYAKTTGLASHSIEPNSGLFVRVLKGDLDVALQAIEKKGNINVLARPKILTLNHKKASLITGQRLGYKTSAIAANTGILTESVNFLEVGIKLSLTPHIAENGDILMEIKPIVSEGVVVNGLPNESTTETDTSVLVKDGQTILIGGLIKNKSTDTRTGVPILSSIPFIDHFFTKNEVVNTKIETVVLITPHLI